MGGLSSTKRTIPLVMAIILWPGFTNADLISDRGVSDSEIRIGNIMPYTGPLAAFGVIGKAEAADFEGSTIMAASMAARSNSSRTMTVPTPRRRSNRPGKLVEIDKVLLMFGSFGTPDNLAVRNYLNDRKTPQLFVASGCQPMLQGKAFGFAQSLSPDATKSCGVFLSFR